MDFHGEAGKFASGVVDDRAAALALVARHGLTGVVTEYEFGDRCYDLAIQQGRFSETKPHHGSLEHCEDDGYRPALWSKDTPKNNPVIGVWIGPLCGRAE